tara:strand:+ start:69394 stop:70146 length:753 start_codon:yes stop_codon:yes gene_type:complete
MAPTKFEENIKEKLDKREMQPSFDAWSKLSERLENQEKKQKGFPFWRLGVAASIIGVLLVASNLYKNDTIGTKPQIVVTPEVIEQDKNSQITLEKMTNFSNRQEETKVLKKTLSIESDEVLKKQPKHKKAITFDKIYIPELNKETKKPEQIVKEEFTYEDQKVKELIAQVKQSKEKNTEVTNAFIDSLLLEAQNEMRLNHLYNKNTQVVNANVLLQDVEADLEQSFRSKVLQSLKDNFITVKTAVAQRND